MIAAAFLSSAGFALVLGLWWLVSHLVAGYTPDILHAHVQSALSVMLLLLIWIAFMGAALAGALAKPRNAHVRHKPPYRGGFRS